MNARTTTTGNKTVTATVLALAFFFLVAGAASALSKKELKRTDKNGPVTITAVFLNPVEKNKDPATVRFEVKLDTHSVDLDQYRLEELSFLRFDDNRDIRSSGVTIEGSGHHKTTVLRFPGPVPENAGKMLLIIKNVGGVPERRLEWKLPLK
ncbi:MAG: hypothetical protein Kow0089_07280 [Desulfobulbaceae bacterium]